MWRKREKPECSERTSHVHSCGMMGKRQCYQLKGIVSAKCLSQACAPLVTIAWRCYLLTGRFSGPYFPFPLTTLLQKISVLIFSNWGCIHNIAALISLRNQRKKTTPPLVVQTFYLFRFITNSVALKSSKVHQGDGCRKSIREVVILFYRTLVRILDLILRVIGS